jgi:hypothetical protein
MLAAHPGRLAVRPTLSSPGEYLSAAQLAAITPWSVAAIEKMMKRGILERDVHYFQPLGPRTQVIFKWSAIVALIEGAGGATARRPGPRGSLLDLTKATVGLRRLLDG